MRTNLVVYVDKQNNMHSRPFRVRLVDRDYPNVNKALTKYFNTRKEAEDYELQVYRIIQFIGVSRD